MAAKMVDQKLKRSRTRNARNRRKPNQMDSKRDEVMGHFIYIFSRFVKPPHAREKKNKNKNRRGISGYGQRATGNKNFSLLFKWMWTSRVSTTIRDIIQHSESWLVTFAETKHVIFVDPTYFDILV